MSFETFRFRGLKQSKGENFQIFTHRCEVVFDRCGFHLGDRDRHIRDHAFQIIKFASNVNGKSYKDDDTATIFAQRLERGESKKRMGSVSG